MGAETMAQKTNVVLIVTDDQGYGDLGCHGNPVNQTPNLDRLHAESVRLTNFHVDPTCSPKKRKCYDANCMLANCPNGIGLHMRVCSSRRLGGGLSRPAAQCWNPRLLVVAQQ
jgi:hypothetical protein